MMKMTMERLAARMQHLLRINDALTRQLYASCHLTLDVTMMQHREPCVPRRLAESTMEQPAVSQASALASMRV